MWDRQCGTGAEGRRGVEQEVRGGVEQAVRDGLCGTGGAGR